MIWVTWRQYRFASFISFIIIAIGIGVAIYYGLAMRQLQQDLGFNSQICPPESVDIKCLGMFNEFKEKYRNVMHIPFL